MNIYDIFRAQAEILTIVTRMEKEIMALTDKQQQARDQIVAELGTIQTHVDSVVQLLRDKLPTLQQQLAQAQADLTAAQQQDQVDKAALADVNTSLQAAQASLSTMESDSLGAFSDIKASADALDTHVETLSA